MLRCVGFATRGRTAALFGTSCARRSAADLTDRAVDEVLSKSWSMPATASPVGTSLAAVGVGGFTLTIVYHIGKPVYDAYTGQGGSDDDE